MILSLDISTSCIGLCVFDENYKLHELTWVKFNAKEKSLFKKLDYFIEFMEKYKHINFTEISIEKELLAFRGKFSNAETLNKLARMNALVSGYLYRKYNVEPEYYNVQAARKIAFPNLVLPKDHPSKKTLLWEAVMKAEPTINWVYSKTGKLADENLDAVDAYVVGMAHIVSTIKQKSKSKKVEEVENKN